MSLAEHAEIVRRRELKNARQQRWRVGVKGSQSKSPFIALDGEGGGTDELGRQNFLYLHAAGGRIDHGLFDRNRPLRTAACLDFILALPQRAVLVGYYFTYDATQILRDLPEERLRFLLSEPEAGRHKGYTYWGRYALQYIPRQFFRIALVVDNGHGKGVIPGTARTVNEVGGFFQKSFVEAITNWEIGTVYQRQAIGAMKELRSTFTSADAHVRKYCQEECQLLAELMTKFRATCVEAAIKPASWRGAGAIAAALYKAHNAPRNADALRPAAFNRMAAMAYYGGRFEVTRIGSIPGPVYEYDINSAYPAAMLKLPCPLHTRWHKFKGAYPPGQPGQPFVADVTFSHPHRLNLCGLPIREKGRLYWPRCGRGTYWSPEIMAAIGAGAEIVAWHGGYYAERKCDCPPVYEWVRELYEVRRRLGKQTQGFPIKLGINALYGKKAQRLGSAPYRDMAEAGLMTAQTRAWLMEACKGHESEIVMLATDGVYSTAPLSVSMGSGLGQWDSKSRTAGMFIVQPGIYWTTGSDELPKTRGIPRSRIIADRVIFEEIWSRWLDQDGVTGGEPPKVPVIVPTFIGHRLALARGKVETAGRWDQVTRNISFDWSTKRRTVSHGRLADCHETAPLPGHLGLKSEPYDPALLTDFAQQQLESEAIPDYEPWGNSDE